MAQTNDEGLLIAHHAQGKSSTQCYPRPEKANRYGLKTYASDSGKNIFLPTLAVGSSNQAIPVIKANTTGNLTGISQKGALSDKLCKIMGERIFENPDLECLPHTLWESFDPLGHPARATASDPDRQLQARMQRLDETEKSVPQLVFKTAHEDKLVLPNTKDLRPMCLQVGDNVADYTTEYSVTSAASMGTIELVLMQ